MIRKRMDYYTSIPQKIDETDNRLAFRRYCQIVAEENRYVVSHLEPLLNFDRRILTLSFNNIFNKPTWFENLEFLPNGLGQRGAVILNTLDFLYHENNNSSLFLLMFKTTLEVILKMKFRNVTSTECVLHY